jgi:hypothetical protein
MAITATTLETAVTVSTTATVYDVEPRKSRRIIAASAGD